MPLDDLNRLITSLQSFQDSIDETVISLTMRYDDDIVEMNEKRITDDNVYVSGNLITPDYAASTEARKGKSTPDLFETGAFVGAITAQVSADKKSIDVISFDTKYKQGLLSVYEEDGDLFGLNHEQLELISSYVKPDLIDAFRETVGV